MEVITLIEDSTAQSDLTPEFGLSLLIKFNGQLILLDTGGSDQFIKNATALDLDLKVVDIAVISHAHFDHGGGLAHFLRLNPDATVYLHQDAQKSYFTNVDTKLPNLLNKTIYPPVKTSHRFSRSIGLDWKALAPYRERLTFVTAPMEIADNLFLLTDVEKKHPLAEGNKFLLAEKEGRLQADDFSHEMVLVIQEDDGLVLFSGCCHSGIVNMIEAVKARFNDTPIKAIIGGFHLKLQPRKETLAGTQKDVEWIANQVNHHQIQKVFTGHCTGDKAYTILEKGLGNRIGRLRTGRVMQI